MSVVEVKDLRKRYGSLWAVDGVSFRVEEGEIFGILGPNGAGKTTTVECVAGLRTPDAGVITVLGLDPQTERDRLRQDLGVQLQESLLPPKIRVYEALHLYRSFYRRGTDPESLLELLGLVSKRRAYFKDLSGGQKQRLSIALALVGDPRVAVLDELTTGLDPQARRETWELIEGVRERGVTIILVTHFMDEAERLCDRVALIDHGKIIALDTPGRLAERVRGGKLVRFRPSAPFDAALLSALPEVRSVEQQGERMVVYGSGDLVNAVIITLASAGIKAHDVELDSPSLEDAFVRLVTGDSSFGPLADETSPPGD